MISIDKIRFDFHAEDETFARNLYVRWDHFYRDAFNDVINDFFTRHDEEGRLFRFESLDLNLGHIPQNEFYEQFPVRLKEELERVFTFQSVQVGVQESPAEQIKRRLSSLRFYLEKGFCPTEWEDEEFDLENEIEFLLLHAPTLLILLFHHSIRQPHRLQRLMWNVPGEQFGRLVFAWLDDRSISQEEKELQLMEQEKDNSGLMPTLYKIADALPPLTEKLSELLYDDKGKNRLSWLVSTIVSVYEKRRLLSKLLETAPGVVTGFIHETQDEKSIRLLASLLNKMMVRQIIDTECENHTEVDVPEYWMYLYDWLIQNYPFNGIYMFGNKVQFQEYLNMKLLHFIRKRPYSAFLSKAELTVQFLIEVFGQEYYLEVLNIIYNQQERNADGSPVYTSYFNMELYHMFLRLSLLKVPVLPEEGEDGAAFSNTKLRERGHLYDLRALAAWLLDKQVSLEEKRIFLTSLGEEQQSVVIQMIKDVEIQPRDFALLNEFMSQAFVDRLVVYISSYTAGLFIRLTEYLHLETDKIKWLSGIAPDHLALHIRTATLRWIGHYKGTGTDSHESIALLLWLLHQEVSGHITADPSLDKSEKEIKKAIATVSNDLKISDGTEIPQLDSGSEEFYKEQEDVFISGTSPGWVVRLRTLMNDRSVSVTEKKRKIALLADVFKDRCESFISTLKECYLLKSSIAIMDQMLYEQLVIRLTKASGEPQSSYLLPLYHWILVHANHLGTFVPGGIMGLKERILILLAHWVTNGSVKNKKSSETGLLFITGLFGTANVTRIVGFIYHELMRDLSGNAISSKTFEAESILNLLLQMADSSVIAPDIPFEKEGRMVNEKREESYLLPFSLQDFIRWTQYEEENEERFRLMYMKYLSTPDDFVAWIKSGAFYEDVKRDVLLRYSVEYPNEFIGLLRQCPKDMAFISILTGIVGMAGVLELTRHISVTKAELLSQIMALLHRKPEILPMINDNGTERENLFCRALLFWLLDEKGIDRKAVQCIEDIRQLVLYLHFSYSDRGVYRESEDLLWQKATDILARELDIQTGDYFFGSFPNEQANGGIQPVLEKSAHDSNRESGLESVRIVAFVQKENITDFLKKENEKVILRRYLAFVMEHHSRELLAFLENDINKDTANKFVDATDEVLLKQLIMLISMSMEPSNAVCFQRLITWALQHISGGFPEKRLVRALLLWIKQKEWRTETQERMREFFFPYLFNTPDSDDELQVDSDDMLRKGKPLASGEKSVVEFSVHDWNEVALTDWLKNPAVNVNEKQGILRKYLIWQPERMLVFIHKLIKEEIILADEWVRWFDEKDWMCMIAGVSLSKAELLEQIMEYLQEKQLITVASVQTGIMRFLMESIPEKWLKESAPETVERFVQLVYQPRKESEEQVEQQAASKEEITKRVLKELVINDSDLDETKLKEEPSFTAVGNAGLALLTPWFPRLFAMVGLLDDEKKDFKDLASRVRAIFIIQRLVTFEEREYKEKDLVFNRILVGCPFAEPLPRRMELTEEELQTIESMLNGVKGNWPKVQNISIRGFQHNFIERSGRLEQREDKWILTVEERSYDMLLDSVPWSYNLVRFPWLTKTICVSWRSKEEF